MFDFTNPFPIAFGGGPTDIETIWRGMRGMVGGEHGPGPEEGIEDLARQQEATAIAGADRAIERAFLQVFPGHATDALPVWEALLLTQGAVDEVELRARLVAAKKNPKGATTPSLAESLTAISPQLSIDLEDADEAIVTVPGKYIAPADNVPPYELASPVGLVSSLFPNYASADVLRVTYALDGAAGEVEIPDDVSRAVTTLLNKRLPAWQTWTLVQQWEGGVFLLDGGDHGESLLDVTPLG